MANPLAKLTISDKVNEGRKRILTCLAKKGAEEDHVNLLELQKQYFLDFETYLNKDELRRFFSKTHIKQVFESFMPKDIEMTTDVEQTGSLYLKMKRTLDVALADNPLSSKRSTVSKNDTKTLNLVPLPAAKFKTDTGLVRREKTLSCSIWDEQINEKIGKDKDSVMKTPNKSTKNQNGVEDLYSSDEHDDMIGLENKDNNDEDEDDDGSDSFGDEALEEGNRLLSSTTKELFKDETNNNNKKIPSNNNIGIRAACHADKYILELQKRKSAATLLDLDKEINNSNKQVSFNEDYEKKRITENVRSRLEFKKLDQLKNKKEPIISSSSAAFGTFKGGKGNSKIKLNNNQRNNFLSTSEDEQEEIEKNNNINYDDEEEGNEDEENGYDEEDNELNLNETKIDFEEDEPVIFMSMPSEGVKNEKIEKKNNLNKDDDLNDFVADEQFYKEEKNNLFNEKKEAASVKQQEIPDHTRLEMIALTSILVRLNVAIKLDALYSELTKYNSTIFASASHFLLFILKNCPINVKIHKCAYNTFLFLWNETPITEDNRKGSLSYLLQKVGKTLEMRQTA